MTKISHSILLALLFGVVCAPSRSEDVDSVVSLLEFVIDVDEDTAAKCLQTLTSRVQSGEVDDERLAAIRQQLGEELREILSSPDSPLFDHVVLLGASWADEQASRVVRKMALDTSAPVERRRAAIDALAAARDAQLLQRAAAILRAESQLAAHLLNALSRYEEASVGATVLACYAELPRELQPKAIELLTERAAWSKALLNAMAREELDRSLLNVNQVRKLLASRDAELAELVRKQWGEIRTERNPQREEVIREMRSALASSTGNPQRGREVFNRVCGECHKIYGSGHDVGPEITRNGRGNYEQLLANVFDPSLVIGAAYQARTVITTDGRVLTGLVAEDNQQRVVLKIQGGKLEIIPRDDVEEMAVSKLSLMPEGLEKQLPRHELADLFAFLVLDGPPEDRNSALISGAPAELLRD